MPSLLVELILTLALGAMFWAIARWLPLRTQASLPEYGWDLVGLVTSLLFIVVAGWLLDRMMGRLIALPEIASWREAVSAAPWWIVVPAYLLVSDFGGYVSHRALHSRPLWHTHAWHHAPRHLNWMSGMRGSLPHMLMTLAPYYLAAFLLPYQAPWIIVTAVAVLAIASQHFTHSNLKVPFARQLEWIFVTPRSHFVHHSPLQRRTDSNFGFLFSIWDRLFGTWTPPDSVPADEPVGLDYRASHWRMLLGLPSRIGSPPERVRRDPT